ncbi:MAG: right-handed parallel beta-helix repeat-containing protein [Candidatus Krumholzibacteria bacterium]|nr:right-handed parallel beta-helix repeat-containing protein [Candidatus Krumholzibacteria bacterium]
MRLISWYFKVLAVFVIFVGSAGCDDSVDFDNAIPGNITITKDLCYLSGGDVVELYATASDPDGDEISFSWSATGGEFIPASGEGSSVSWTAPAGAGTHTLTVSVSDGLDTGTRAIEIEVGEEIIILPGSNEYFDNGSYYIYSQAAHITVRFLSSLSLNEGVTIIFDNEYSGITIEGEFQALGTPGNPVVLRTNYCPGESEKTWEGVRIAGENAVGVMKHCEISNAYAGVSVRDYATATLDTCSMSDSGGFGVEIYNNSSVEITGCKIWENANGIRSYDSDVTIRSSSIRYNYQFGIHAGGGSARSLDIENSHISNNIEGFRLSDAVKPRVKNCSIFLNEAGGNKYGIRLSSYTGGGVLDFTDNYWGVTDAVSIAALFNTVGGNATIDFDPWLNESPAGD